MATDSKRLAELELLKNRKFTATGAITAGDRVSLLSDGTVSVTSSSNVANYLGIAAENIANGAAGKIKVIADLVDGQSGLTPNKYYYVANDGTLSEFTSSNSLVGRAISATEIFLTNEIHGLPPPAYGASGSEVMSTGGSSNSNQVEKKLFSSTAISTNHGTLATANSIPGVASDGAQVMLMAGYSSNYTANTELKQFASSATGVSNGNMTLARYYTQNSGSSDGTQGMLQGGSIVGTNYNICELKLFATTATATTHGSLGSVRNQQCCASDSIDVIACGGSVAADGNNQAGDLDTSIEKKSWTSSATSTSHGNLQQTRTHVTSDSDGTHAYVIGGIVVSTYRSTVEKIAFASNTTASSHATLTTPSHYVSSGSDGAQSLIYHGYIGQHGPLVNAYETIQFASTANSVDHGDSMYTRYSSTASGN